MVAAGLAATSASVLGAVTSVKRGAWDIVTSGLVDAKPRKVKSCCHGVLRRASFTTMPFTGNSTPPHKAAATLGFPDSGLGMHSTA